MFIYFHTRTSMYVCIYIHLLAHMYVCVYIYIICLSVHKLKNIYILYIHIIGTYILLA